MSSNKQVLSGLTPLLLYSLATYVMVAPAFTVTQFNLPQWLSFLIVSIPFGGRIIGSLTYQRLIVSLGSKALYVFSTISLGILSVASGITINIPLLLAVRAFIGVVFGIATSLAVEEAVSSGKKLLVALTMSGWAFGWIGGAIAYIYLKEWTLIALSGLITSPFSLLYPNVTDFARYKNQSLSLPSLTSVLIFFFSFEPAFVLQLAPSIVEDQGGIIWVIIGYALSIPMYLLVPRLSISEAKVTAIYTLVSAISGVLFFQTSIPYVLVLFTAFGLGINSIAPRLASAYGATPRNMGIALNTAALGGVIVPVVSSIDIKAVATLFTAISMTILLILSVRAKTQLGVGIK
ncbi:transporter [Stygiolobus caldivivus]|uniref:Transporter n=1 Tax=Stygiolobus caldivivus TaxID=2824673 RepID=A0A8D5U7D2_9CREN|nr:transporter [Stygiolobus caldivivus]BCU70149.1 hypothetical protein KN1_14460 [Stygiolobus caldivivus]